MKGITVTVSESNGKILIDWGMKGMSDLDLRNVPNVFGLREYVASKIGKRNGLFSRIREATAFAVRKVAAFIAPSEKPRIQAGLPGKEATVGAEKPATNPNVPFYDFTRDDLGVPQVAQASPDKDAPAQTQTFPLPFPKAPAFEASQARRETAPLQTA